MMCTTEGEKKVSGKHICNMIKGTEFQLGKLFSTYTQLSYAIPYRIVFSWTKLSISLEPLVQC